MTKLSLSEQEKQLRIRERQLAERIAKERQRVFDRFPLLFTMLGAFGLAATIYGFERVLDRISLFADNPFYLLALGIGILVFTGSLYSRLK